MMPWPFVFAHYESRLALELAMLRLAAVAGPGLLLLAVDEMDLRSDRMGKLEAAESVYDDVIAGRLRL